MKGLILILGLITSFAYAQSKAGFYVVGGKIITVQDTSSQKYLKAIEGAGNTNTILQNFVSNFLVTTEKAIGSYSLMKAQYPFIGGTAATHKFNMNDPRDLDAAFRLTFPNGATHDANGILFNGSTQYANTFFNPTTALSNPKTDISLSFYITGGTGLGASSLPNTMGAQGNNDSDFNNYETALGSRTSLSYFATAGEGFSGNVANTLTSFFENGYFLGTTKSGSVSLFKKSIKIATSTPNASGFAANGNIFLGANSVSTNTAPIGANQNVRLGYSQIGLGMTDAIGLQQSKIVTAFNGFLSRN